MHLISAPFIVLIVLLSLQVENSLAKISVIDQTFNANPQGKSFHSSCSNGIYHLINQKFFLFEDYIFLLIF